MAKARFYVEDGITVKDLKAILSDLPEQDADGDDAVIYVLAGNAHLSPLTEVILDDDGSSIMVPEFHSDLMQMLGSYDEFFGFEPEMGEDGEEEMDDEQD